MKENPLNLSVCLKENANARKNKTNIGPSRSNFLKKITVDINTKTITKTVKIKFDLFFIFKIPGW